MTKKEFKEQCSFHEYGYGKNKHNAIYFDWKSTDLGRGFKYGVASAVEFVNMAKLFNHFYDWVHKQIEPPYSVRYKYASEDHRRFKTPLVLNW